MQTRPLCQPLFRLIPTQARPFPPFAAPQLTLERLARHFLGVAGETLSVVRKTESSLRRFKSRQRLAEGQAQAAAAPSDTGSLVAQQLALDVEVRSGWEGPGHAS